MKSIFIKLSTLILIIANTACSKSSDTNIGKTNIQLSNASQGGSSNFYVNGNMVKENLGYPSSTGFMNIDGGMSSLYATPWRSTSVLAAANIVFEPQKCYTVFLIDSLTKAKIISVVSDTVASAMPDFSKVRFFNFSPNSPALDIKVSNLGTVNNDYTITNLSFNDQESNSNKLAFREVYYGGYQIDVYLAGTTNLIYTHNLTFLKNTNYTFFIKGAYGQSDFGIGAVTHN